MNLEAGLLGGQDGAWRHAFRQVVDQLSGNFFMW